MATLAGKLPASFSFSISSLVTEEASHFPLVPDPAMVGEVKLDWLWKQKERALEL